MIPSRMPTLRQSDRCGSARLPPLRPRLLLLALVGVLAGTPAVLRALDPQKSLWQYNCRNWTRQTGLPAGRIGAIAQTRDGFLWLGTQTGLVRFDGLTFTSYPIDEPEARGHEVRCLVASQRGDLLVAVRNGAFGRFADGRFSVLDDPAWPRTNVTAKTLMETRDGTVWTGSNLGVGSVGRGGPAPGCYVGTPSARVWSLCEDSAGRIWGGLDDGTVFRLEAGRLVPVVDPATAADSILTLVGDQAGRIWAGSSKALRCYDSAGRSVAVPPQIASVNALLLDRQGNLWVGTEGTACSARPGTGFRACARPTALSATTSRRSARTRREASGWARGTGSASCRR